uniref:DNA-directed RNA polymerase subunit beta'' n=1 Tax=Lobochlamys segnis TaxID=52035 RepID=A0A0S2IBX8_9CHLO|nr:beta'' subunit of RNA polymerase [Lobochlamys segnis]
MVSNTKKTSLCFSFRNSVLNLSSGPSITLPSFCNRQKSSILGVKHMTTLRTKKSFIYSRSVFMKSVLGLLLPKAGPAQLETNHGLKASFSAPRHRFGLLKELQIQGLLRCSSLPLLASPVGCTCFASLALAAFAPANAGEVRENHKGERYSLKGEGSWKQPCLTQVKKKLILSQWHKLDRGHVKGWSCICFATRDQKEIVSRNYSLEKTFLNYTFDKGRLKSLVSWFLLNFGDYKTIQLLEQLKNIGFNYATKAGISLGIEDLKIPPKKADLIFEAENDTNLAVNQYNRGEITGVERFQRLIDTWHRTSEILKQEVINHFEETDILNPVYMMAFSGARGNISQVRQLVGMRGLMADPQGQLIDYPIRSNFREGLTLTEYIISSYGARKGIVDTALRTANAGYLTRRLVDVAQHVIISHFDCGTQRGIYLNDMKEGKKIIYSLSNRLIGRVLARNIYRNSDSLPNANQKVELGQTQSLVEKSHLIAEKNQEISATLALDIVKVCNKVFVRSSLTCDTKKLVCQLCYGWSLAQGNLVSIGEAVGVIAAQSIGEPGTQLTMRTFHTGGVFSSDISDQIRAPFNGFVYYHLPIPGILIRNPEGKICFLTKDIGYIFVSKNPINQDMLGFEDRKIENQKHLSETASENVKKDLKRFKIPAYTILFLRNSEKTVEKQVIGQMSSISLQTNKRDTAELVIKSELEGQFYCKDLNLVEKFIGPKISPNANLNQSYLTKMDQKFESLSWGYAWILSGKIYQLPISSYLFPFFGDFVSKNSAMAKINWLAPSNGTLFYSLENTFKFSNFNRLNKVEHPNISEFQRNRSGSLQPYFNSKRNSTSSLSPQLLPSPSPSSNPSGEALAGERSEPSPQGLRTLGLRKPGLWLSPASGEAALTQRAANARETRAGEEVQPGLGLLTTGKLPHLYGEGSKPGNEVSLSKSMSPHTSSLHRSIGDNGIKQNQPFIHHRTSFLKTDNLKVNFLNKFSELSRFTKQFSKTEQWKLMQSSYKNVNQTVFSFYISKIKYKELGYFLYNSASNSRTSRAIADCGPLWATSGKSNLQQSLLPTFHSPNKVFPCLLPSPTRVYDSPYLAGESLAWRNKAAFSSPQLLPSPSPQGLGLGSALSMSRLPVKVRAATSAEQRREEAAVGKEIFFIPSGLTKTTQGPRPFSYKLSSNLTGLSSLKPTSLTLKAVAPANAGATSASPARSEPQGLRTLGLLKPVLETGPLSAQGINASRPPFGKKQPSFSRAASYQREGGVTQRTLDLNEIVKTNRGNKIDNFPVLKKSVFKIDNKLNKTKNKKIKIIQARKDFILQVYPNNYYKNETGLLAKLNLNFLWGAPSLALHGQLPSPALAGSESSQREGVGLLTQDKLRAVAFQGQLTGQGPRQPMPWASTITAENLYLSSNFQFNPFFSTKKLGTSGFSAISNLNLSKVTNTEVINFNEKSKKKFKNQSLRFDQSLSLPSFSRGSPSPSSPALAGERSEPQGLLKPGLWLSPASSLTQRAANARETRAGEEVQPGLETAPTKDKYVSQRQNEGKNQNRVLKNFSGLNVLVNFVKTSKAMKFLISDKKITSPKKYISFFDFKKYFVENSKGNLPSISFETTNFNYLSMVHSSNLSTQGTALLSFYSKGRLPVHLDSGVASNPCSFPGFSRGKHSSLKGEDEGYYFPHPKGLGVSSLASSRRENLYGEGEGSKMKYKKNIFIIGMKRSFATSLLWTNTKKVVNSVSSGPLTVVEVGDSIDKPIFNSTNKGCKKSNVGSIATEVFQKWKQKFRFSKVHDKSHAYFQQVRLHWGLRVSLFNFDKTSEQGDSGYEIKSFVKDFLYTLNKRNPQTLKASIGVLLKQRIYFPHPYDSQMIITMMKKFHSTLIFRYLIFHLCLIFDHFNFSIYKIKEIKNIIYQLKTLPISKRLNYLEGYAGFTYDDPSLVQALVYQKQNRIAEGSTEATPVFLSSISVATPSPARSEPQGLLKPGLWLSPASSQRETRASPSPQGLGLEEVQPGLGVSRLASSVRSRRENLKAGAVAPAGCTSCDRLPIKVSASPALAGEDREGRPVIEQDKAGADSANKVEFLKLNFSQISVYLLMNKKALLATKETSLKDLFYFLPQSFYKFNSQLEPFISVSKGTKQTIKPQLLPRHSSELFYDQSCFFPQRTQILAKARAASNPCQLEQAARKGEGSPINFASHSTAKSIKLMNLQGQLKKTKQNSFEKLNSTFNFIIKEVSQKMSKENNKLNLVAYPKQIQTSRKVYAHDLIQQRRLKKNIFSAEHPKIILSKKHYENMKSYFKNFSKFNSEGDEFLTEMPFRKSKANILDSGLPLINVSSAKRRAKSLLHTNYKTKTNLQSIKVCFPVRKKYNLFLTKNKYFSLFYKSSTENENMFFSNDTQSKFLGLSLIKKTKFNWINKINLINTKVSNIKSFIFKYFFAKGKTYPFKRVSLKKQKVSYKKRKVLKLKKKLKEKTKDWFDSFLRLFRMVIDHKMKQKKQVSMSTHRQALSTLLYKRLERRLERKIRPVKFLKAFFRNKNYKIYAKHLLKKINSMGAKRTYYQYLFEKYFNLQNSVQTLAPASPSPSSNPSGEALAGERSEPQGLGLLKPELEAASNTNLYGERSSLSLSPASSQRETRASPEGLEEVQPAKPVARSASPALAGEGRGEALAGSLRQYTQPKGKTFKMREAALRAAYAVFQSEEPTLPTVGQTQPSFNERSSFAKPWEVKKKAKILMGSHNDKTKKRQNLKRRLSQTTATKNIKSNVYKSFFYLLGDLNSSVNLLFTVPSGFCLNFSSSKNIQIKINFSFLNFIISKVFRYLDSTKTILNEFYKIYYHSFTKESRPSPDFEFGKAVDFTFDGQPWPWEVRMNSFSSISGFHSSTPKYPTEADRLAKAQLWQKSRADSTKPFIEENQQDFSSPGKERRQSNPENFVWSVKKGWIYKPINIPILKNTIFEASSNNFIFPGEKSINDLIFDSNIVYFESLKIESFLPQLKINFDLKQAVRKFDHNLFCDNKVSNDNSGIDNISSSPVAPALAGATALKIAPANASPVGLESSNASPSPPPQGLGLLKPGLEAELKELYKGFEQTKTKASQETKKLIESTEILTVEKSEIFDSDKQVSRPQKQKNYDPKPLLERFNFNNLVWVKNKKPRFKPKFGIPSDSMKHLILGSKHFKGLISSSYSFVCPPSLPSLSISKSSTPSLPGDITPYTNLQTFSVDHMPYLPSAAFADGTANGQEQANPHRIEEKLALNLHHPLVEVTLQKNVNTRLKTSEKFLRFKDLSTHFFRGKIKKCVERYYLRKSDLLTLFRLNKVALNRGLNFEFKTSYFSPILQIIVSSSDGIHRTPSVFGLNFSSSDSIQALSWRTALEVAKPKTGSNELGQGRSLLSQVLKVEGNFELSRMVYEHMMTQKKENVLFIRTIREEKTFDISSYKTKLINQKNYWAGSIYRSLCLNFGKSMTWPSVKRQESYSVLMKARASSHRSNKKQEKYFYFPLDLWRWIFKFRQSQFNASSDCGAIGYGSLWATTLSSLPSPPKAGEALTFMGSMLKPAGATASPSSNPSGEALAGERSEPQGLLKPGLEPAQGKPGKTKQFQLEQDCFAAGSMQKLYNCGEPLSFLNQKNNSILLKKAFNDNLTLNKQKITKNLFSKNSNKEFNLQKKFSFDSVFQQLNLNLKTSLSKKKSLKKSEFFKTLPMTFDQLLCNISTKVSVLAKGQFLYGQQSQRSSPQLLPSPKGLLTQGKCEQTLAKARAASNSNPAFAAGEGERLEQAARKGEGEEQKRGEVQVHRAVSLPSLNRSKIAKEKRKSTFFVFNDTSFNVFDESKNQNQILNEIIKMNKIYCYKPINFNTLVIKLTLPNSFDSKFKKTNFVLNSSKMNFPSKFFLNNKYFINEFYNLFKNKKYDSFEQMQINSVHSVNKTELTQPIGETKLHISVFRPLLTNQSQRNLMEMGFLRQHKPTVLSVPPQLFLHPHPKGLLLTRRVRGVSRRKGEAGEQPKVLGKAKALFNTRATTGLVFPCLGQVKNEPELLKKREFQSSLMRNILNPTFEQPYFFYYLKMKIQINKLKDFNFYKKSSRNLYLNKENQKKLTQHWTTKFLASRFQKNNSKTEFLFSFNQKISIFHSLAQTNYYSPFEGEIIKICEEKLIQRNFLFSNDSSKAFELKSEQNSSRFNLEKIHLNFSTKNKNCLIVTKTDCESFYRPLSVNLNTMKIKTKIFLKKSKQEETRISGLSVLDLLSGLSTATNSLETSSNESCSVKQKSSLSTLLRSTVVPFADSFFYQTSLLAYPESNTPTKQAIELKIGFSKGNKLTQTMSNSHKDKNDIASIGNFVVPGNLNAFFNSNNQPINNDFKLVFSKGFMKSGQVIHLGVSKRSYRIDNIIDSLLIIQENKQINKISKNSLFSTNNLSQPLKKVLKKNFQTKGLFSLLDQKELNFKAGNNFKISTDMEHSDSTVLNKFKNSVDENLYRESSHDSILTFAFSKKKTNISQFKTSKSEKDKYWIITLRKAQPLFVSPKSIFHVGVDEFVDRKNPVMTLTYERLKTGDIVQGIPKVEQFFEARTTKRGRLFLDNIPNLLKGLFLYYKNALYLYNFTKQRKYSKSVDSRPLPVVKQSPSLSLSADKLMKKTSRLNKTSSLEVLFNKKPSKNKKASPIFSFSISKNRPVQSHVVETNLTQSGPSLSGLASRSIVPPFGLSRFPLLPSNPNLYGEGEARVSLTLGVREEAGESEPGKKQPHDMIIDQKLNQKKAMPSAEEQNERYSKKSFTQLSEVSNKTHKSISNIVETESSTNITYKDAVRQSIYKIQQIIVDGVQRVYKAQGVTIADKHLEIIVKQMTAKVRILHGGQTGFFPGETVNLDFVEHINSLLMRGGAEYEPQVLGITKASLEVESFLSAASFQQTTKILSSAALSNKKDFLKGLKQNVILGNLIPAGTGYYNT